MKRLFTIALLVFVGFAGWRAGGILSSDAMGMAVGIVFGVLASLPAALLMLAASRRTAPSQTTRPNTAPEQMQRSQLSGQQMPVVLLAPPAWPGHGLLSTPQTQQFAGHPAGGWPQQPARPERAFTIVGEASDFADEF
ncbi:MAG: hypothetical protein KF753_22080 [Caldilineaceae bacterium]|nr:hypothetical protein [Caldilineaceae bacterium]